MLIQLALAFAVQVLIFVPLERLFTLLPGQRVLRPGLWLDLVLFIFNSTITALAVIYVLRVLRPDFGAGNAHSGYLQFFEALALSEVATYWSHRLSHKIPILWKFHKLHHETNGMDWMSTYRQHPVDIFIQMLVGNLPAVMLGISLAPFLSFLVFQKLFTAFIHGNVRIGYRPFRFLIATPRFHRWHHGARADQGGSNFAGMLPFIDVIFGTAHLDESVYPEKLGLEPLRPERPRIHVRRALEHQVRDKLA